MKVKADNLLLDLTMLKDQYLIRHNENVACYASILAGIVCPSLSKMTFIAALHHDTGKIGIPDHILFKQSLLDESEWIIVRQHPIVGAELFSNSNRNPGSDLDTISVSLAIRHHHERWDGTGYPDGLSGEEIPLASRIIAVADAYDAMTTNRPYRKSIGKSETLREIMRLSGKQFDPSVVNALKKAFLDIVAYKDYLIRELQVNIC